MFYAFQDNDVIKNTIKTFPSVNFFIYDKIYLNFEDQNHWNSNTPSGHLNVLEENVNRASGLIFPFVTKNGSLFNLRGTSTAEFDSFLYGDTITGSYPLTGTISVDRISPSDTDRRLIRALNNVLNYNKLLSPHMAYSSSLGDKGTQEVTLISIPAMFYGDQIKKGSVNLKLYVTGALMGQLQDTKLNGELVEVVGSSTGSVAGVVLYNEGFILLTGSWDISNGNFVDDYTLAGVGNEVAPAWKYFGVTGSAGMIVSSSFQLSFSGSNEVNSMTMFCHVPMGELNFSNNPSFTVSGQTEMVSSGSFFFAENDEVEVKNTVGSVYTSMSASFAPQTFISKIGIYDEDKNLIGVVKLANPIRKRESDSFSFKIKIDS